MKTIEEIRLANLTTMRSGFPSERQFAIKLNKAPNQVNQWFGKGAARAIQSESAREVEAIMGKPRGWLDNDHSQLERLDASTILSAYREAVTKYEATGLSAKTFKPLEDPDHAGLLALAIAAQVSGDASDGSTQADVEVGRGSTRKNRAGSGTAGKDRPAEDGREAGAKTGRHRKSA